MRCNFFVIMALLFPLIIIGSSELSPREYFAIKRNIDKQHEEIVRNWTRKIMLRGIPPKQELFEKAFNEYKNNIDQLRNDVLEKFQRNSAIDDESWNYFMEKSSTIHQLHANKNKEELKYLQYSDSPFPTDADFMIKRELKDYGISSKTIELKGDLEDPFFYGVTVACNERDMSCLALNRIAWRKANYELRQCMCICMVAELVEKLSFVRQHIGDFFPGVITSFKEPYLFDNIITLENAARVLSALSASLRSSQNASLLRKYAPHMVTTYFSPDAYSLLATIESMWQISDTLNAYFTSESDSDD